MKCSNVVLHTFHVGQWMSASSLSSRLPQKSRASMVKLSLVVVEKRLIGPEFSGNSGGPVLGAHGLVVGMACSHLKNVPALSDAEVRHQIWVFSYIFGLNLTWLVWLFWVFHPFKPEFNYVQFMFYFLCIWYDESVQRSDRKWLVHVSCYVSLCLSLSLSLWKGRLMLPAPLSSGHAVLLCHCFFCLVDPWMPTIWSRHQKAWYPCSWFNVNMCHCVLQLC